MGYARGRWWRRRYALDVVEIGAAALEMGSVTPVKPVGVYAMIDDGELDWKVIAISSNDPKVSVNKMRLNPEKKIKNAAVRSSFILCALCTT